MKVVIGYPPNILEIRKKFNLPKTVMFAYGDTLYNPDNKRIDPALWAHEETHQRQQAGDPEKWWKRYLRSPKFRISQEVEAYRNQIAKFKEDHHDRNFQARFTHLISLDLSGAIYGYMISYREAFELLTAK